MTTIRSTRRAGRELTGAIVDDEVTLSITQDDAIMAAISVLTADLAAALGLVTREDVERTTTPDLTIHLMKEEALETRAEIAEQANAALRAELDQANATLARVRELTECGAHSLTRETIRAALDPKPPFKRDNPYREAP